MRIRSEQLVPKRKKLKEVDTSVFYLVRRSVDDKIWDKIYRAISQQLSFFIARQVASFMFQQFYETSFKPIRSDARPNSFGASP